MYRHGTREHISLHEGILARHRASEFLDEEVLKALVREKNEVLKLLAPWPSLVHVVP